MLLIFLWYDVRTSAVRGKVKEEHTSMKDELNVTK
jgi:hypothetical protein